MCADAFGLLLGLWSFKKEPKNAAGLHRPCGAGTLATTMKSLEKEQWEGLSKELLRFEKGAEALSRPRGKNKVPNKETPLVSAAWRIEAQNRLREKLMTLVVVTLRDVTIRYFGGDAGN
jgi:hypothetical protein